MVIMVHILVHVSILLPILVHTLVHFLVHITAEILVLIRGKLFLTTTSGELCLTTHPLMAESPCGR